MAALDPTKSRVMEFVAAFVIVAFTAMEAFMTIAPYLGYSAAGGDIASLAQQQTLVQTIMVAIISFLFGASVSNQKKDDSINTLATTNAAVSSAATTSGEPAIAAAPQPGVKKP